MSTRRFLLVAAFAAMAFTFFACSGDEPGGDGNSSSSDGGGSSFSDLPKQVYLKTGKKYEGDGDIALVLEKYEGAVMYTYGSIGGRTCVDDGVNYVCNEPLYSDILSVGKIQNGRMQLNLPDIDGKYIVRFEPCEIEKEYGYECKVSFPENLTGFSTRAFHATIPGESNCQIIPILVKSDNYYGRVYLDYFLESGKIIGTNCTGGGTSPGGFDCDLYNHFDWNFSKGWNIRYRYEDSYNQNQNVDNYNHTTDLSKAGGELVWMLECRDGDSGGGGDGKSPPNP